MLDEAQSEPELSVVIPAFDEEEAIAPTLASLHAVLAGAGIEYEVIVVDDGSSDRTGEIAEGAGSETERARTRVLREARNRGYGAALKRGIAAARADLVLITDADGTYPAGEIPRLYAKAADFDMVVGARTGEDVNVPLSRQPAKWVLRKLAGYLAGQKIPDLNSGLRVMRREHVRRFAHILPPGFSFTTTITLALLSNDMTVGYVPIDYHRRIGRSKVRAVDAWHFLLLILRVIVLFNPLKVFLPLGALAFVAGLLKFAYDVTKANLSESAVMCLLAAVIIWAVGLLADQNSRLGLDRDSWGR